ncbi:unnamed protein product [Aureobasidium vineae]|uniref:F-box domain-containing protein n=1 Tax=Aureobasidium vineae TaxID=2773715 RepID=A0A9N8JS04_9PEZI|nr:unnamed protein product [Aureobasidium vineae]
MLRLPNELISRIADFSQDKDLLSIRLTCKHLEQITSKHFIAAFITEPHFHASLACVQRLEELITHPKLECRALLAKIFAKISCLRRDFQFGVVCHHPISDQSSEPAIRAADFARLMFDARPPGLPSATLNIDLRQLPDTDIDYILQSHLLFLPGALFQRGAPGVDRNTITENGTRFKLDGLEHGFYTNCCMDYWLSKLPVQNMHIVNCEFSVRSLALLLGNVRSSPWHLELKDCHFNDGSSWTKDKSRDFEAASPYEIRERLNTVRFAEQPDSDEEGD